MSELISAIVVVISWYNWRRREIIEYSIILLALIMFTVVYYKRYEQLYIFRMMETSIIMLIIKYKLAG